MAKLPLPISLSRLNSPMILGCSAGGGTRRSECRSMIAIVPKHEVRCEVWMCRIRVYRRQLVTTSIGEAVDTESL